MSNAVLTLTKREAKVLVVAVDAGIRSGLMLSLLKTPDDDLALVDAVVKLKEAAKDG